MCYHLFSLPSSVLLLLTTTRYTPVEVLLKALKKKYWFDFIGSNLLSKINLINSTVTGNNIVKKSKYYIGQSIRILGLCFGII